MQSFFDIVIKAGPELLTGFVLIALGYVLKLVPCFSNKIIPITIIALSVTFYCVTAGERGVAPNDVAYPILRRAGIGLVVAVFSWKFHQYVLKGYIDKKLFKRKPGDTEQWNTF